MEKVWKPILKWWWLTCLFFIVFWGLLLTNNVHVHLRQFELASNWFQLLTVEPRRHRLPDTEAHLWPALELRFHEQKWVDLYRCIHVAFIIFYSTGYDQQGVGAKPRFPKPRAPMENPRGFSHGGRSSPPILQLWQKHLLRCHPWHTKEVRIQFPVPSVSVQLFSVTCF